jgi:hypothetical protein
VLSQHMLAGCVKPDGARCLLVNFPSRACLPNIVFSFPDSEPVRWASGSAFLHRCWAFSCLNLRQTWVESNMSARYQRINKIVILINHNKISVVWTRASSMPRCASNIIICCPCCCSHRFFFLFLFHGSVY